LLFLLLLLLESNALFCSLFCFNSADSDERSIGLAVAIKHACSRNEITNMIDFILLIGLKE
jgi:hypothetical protein